MKRFLQCVHVFESEFWLPWLMDYPCSVLKWVVTYLPIPWVSWQLYEVMTVFISLIFFFLFVTTLLLYTYIKYHAAYHRFVHLLFNYTPVMLRRQGRKRQGRTVTVH